MAELLPYSTLSRIFGGRRGPFDQSFDFSFDPFNDEKQPLIEALPQEDEKSLIRTLGGSAFAAVGNTLDTPGAFSRDIISNLLGRPANPFKNILDTEHRTTGRDLLEQIGVLGPNEEGFDWGDVPGFAAEIATDPLTYLSLGGSAVTKLGKVMKNAGLLGDAARVASKIAGRAVGPAEARLLTTGRQLLKEAPDATRALDAIADATRAEKSLPLNFLDQTLGGPVGWGAPFGAPSYIPSGPLSHALARGIDKATGALRWSAPGRMAARIFGAANRDRAGRVGQEAAQHMSRAKDVYEMTSQELAGRLAESMYSTGLQDTSPQQLYKWFEQIEPMPHQPEFKPFREAVKAIWKHQDAMPAEITALGGNLAPLTPGMPGTGSKYWHRYFMGAEDAGFHPNSAFLPGDAGSLARQEYLKQIHGGTAQIIDMLQSASPELNNLLAQAKVSGDPTKIAQALDQMYPGAFKAGDALAHAASLAGKAAPTAQEIAAARFAQINELAQLIARSTPEQLKAGGYAHPLVALTRRLGQYDTGLAGTEAVVDALGRVVQRATPSTDPAATLSLREFMAGHGLQDPFISKVGDALPATLRAELAQQAMQGQNLWNLIGDLRIPRNIAEDLGGLVGKYRAPESINTTMDMFDSLQSLWKGMVTGVRPAFHTRNRASGFVQNLMKGVFSPWSHNAAADLISGGVVKGAAAIPAVGRILAERGLPLTDDAGTSILRELAFGAGVRDVGQHGDVLTRHLGGNAFSDIAEQLPGRKPLGWGDVGRASLDALTGRAPRQTGFKSAINPLGTRGWQGAEHSTFAPSAIGDVVGNRIEAMNRYQPWLEMVRQGIDPAEAGRRVAQSQVGYGAKYYTPTERSILARVFPFYKFAKGSTADLLRTLAEHPGGAHAITLKGLPKLEETFAPRGPLPEHIQDTTAISLPAGPSGDRRYLTNLGLMFEQPVQILHSPLREALGSLTPALKYPGELATGTSFFQAGPQGGRSLQDLDPVLGRIAANLTGRKEPVPIAPDAVENALMNSPLSALLTAIRTATDPRKTLSDKFWNLGTGLRVTDVSQRQEERVVQELADQLLGRNANTFTTTYVKPELYPFLPEDQQLVARLLKTIQQRAQERARAARKAELP